MKHLMVKKIISSLLFCGYFSAKMKNFWLGWNDRTSLVSLDDPDMVLDECYFHTICWVLLNLGLLLLTQINFNPSIDEQLHPL